MNRLVMSVALPLAVVACVALVIGAVGLFFLSLGEGALVAALVLVVLVMVVASVVNARMSPPERGEHSGR